MPNDETQRLAMLRAYGVLDTPPEAAYDRIVRLAARATQMPIALVSLIDENRQWFKARLGLEVCETERKLAFCAHTILQNEVMVVLDTRQDARFAKNPLVKGVPSLRFYAGAPLRAAAGHVVGTLCVLDTVPRLAVDEDLKATLQDLADMVIHELEVRLSGRRHQAQGEVHRANQERLSNFENQLRVIVRHAPIAMAVFDKDVRYLAASELWKEMHSLDSADFVGRSYYQAIPDLPEHVRDLHRRCLAGESVAWDDHRRECSAGFVGRVRCKMHPWHAPDGGVAGIVMFTDLHPSGASSTGAWDGVPARA